jgi:hypothetical protein
VKKKFLDFKKYPLRNTLLAVFLFGASYLVQKSSFFNNRVFEINSQTLLVNLLNHANHTLHQRHDHQATTRLESSFSFSRESRRSAAPHFSFPKGLLVKAQRKLDLPSQVIGTLMNELEWPLKLSIHHLYPKMTEPRYNSNQKEIFINYDFKVQGFLVPQSNLRAMLFETKNAEYQIVFIEHHFQLPPDSNFSIRVNPDEAIHKAQLSENRKYSLWQISKEWRFANEDWKPTWKVQLRGSPRTHYVDVRNGQQETDVTELGGTNDFYIRGLGNPPLSHEPELEPLNLPWIQAITPTSQILNADAHGFMQTELPLAALMFSLTSSLVEVKDYKENGINYEFDDSSSDKQLLLNPKGEKDQTAMINAFTAITAVHDYLVNLLVFSSETLNTRLTAFVNVDYQDCNAKYRNGLVAFFQESEECRNTAFDTVIYHEYAHFVDDLFGGIQDKALSEGMGDVLTSFMTGQPLVGQELYKKTSAALRTTDNKIVFYETANAEDQSSASYDNGQAWSGFAWDARRALIEKYGSIDGKNRAEKLFLTPLQTNAASIKSAVAEVFARSAQGLDLKLDADYELLHQAAKKHGLDFKL